MTRSGALRSAAQLATVWACGSLLALASACAGATTVLDRRGVTGSRETSLGLFLLITSVAVIVVISILVLMAVFRRRGATEPVPTESDTRWIWAGGIALPLVILIVAYVLTLRTLAAVAVPDKGAAASIRITGHQWWWEATYVGARPDDLMTTANEIHVPVGEPVRLQLASSDVIHTFWVPQLAGKTQLIPGEHNAMWLEAKEPGIYGGACTQYCGAQHARMRLTVIAEDPRSFQRWLDDQRNPASTMQDTGVAAGRQVFLRSACAGCHTIRGTLAGGAVGPDLTHFGSRMTLAAGALPATRGNLAAWIADPQGIKPGTLMPATAVTPHDLLLLVAYLQSLK